ncbi:MAG: hypothetical protein AAB393_02895 [Bacteroidota bacterium]
MKYSSFILALALAASLLGCSQEGSTPADATVSPVVTDIAKPAPLFKSVDILGVVVHPRLPKPRNLIAVDGQALYAFHRTPASDEGIYNMEILTNGRLLTRGGDQLAQINDASIQSVSFEDGMGPIEKKYAVKGLSCTLHIEFDLQASTLSVMRMWISVEKDPRAAADHQ